MNYLLLTGKYLLLICVVNTLAACGGDEIATQVPEQAQIQQNEQTAEQLEQQRRQAEIQYHGHSHD